MNTEIKFTPLTSTYYQLYYQIVKQSDFGAILLPKTYKNNLWGTIALHNNKVVGGWVGTLRGNKPIVSLLAKGVWFDSHPIFEGEVDQNILHKLVDYTKDIAKKERIVFFNLTHWVRQQYKGDWISMPQPMATFLIDLQQDIDIIWGAFNRRLRTIVRKAERNEVEYKVVKEKEALDHLTAFQSLRETTQKRAVKNNPEASMLLKSDEFFTNLIQTLNVHLFIATHNNRTASVAMGIQSGKTLYMYMGGSDMELNRKTGASVYLIWKAIEHAHSLGLTFIDLGGVPVNPDATHPAYGVYQFKESFGGEYREFMGGDVVISKWKYKIVNWAKSNKRILRLFSKKL